MSQTQKDFLALSHGQEWLSFYESFDKLVQDNLARSSELLRRAMALPEVADREVQQIRNEMEEKLATEKKNQRELLASLLEELNGSYRQVSMLARSVGTVIGDLERLSQRVGEAIASYDLEEANANVVVSAAPNGAAPANGAAPVNGVASAAYPAAPVEAAAPYRAPAAEAVEPVSAEPEAAATSTEEPAAVEADGGMADLAAAMDEQQAILDAAEKQLESLEAAIDLSALAEAETEPEAAAEEAPAEAQAGESEASDIPQIGEQRPRPHWLSVTRAGLRS